MTSTLAIHPESTSSAARLNRPTTARRCWFSFIWNGGTIKDFIHRKRWHLTEADCAMRVIPRGRGLMAAAWCVLCLGTACRESGGRAGGQDGGRQDAAPSASTNDVGTTTSGGKDEVGPNTGADAGPNRDGSGDIGVRLDAEVSTGVSIDASASSSWLSACSAYAKAACKLDACRPYAIYAFFGSEENCEARHDTVNCEAQMTSAGSHVTPSSLAACAQAMATESCADASVRLPAECSWQGDRANNSACAFGQQCQSGVCELSYGMACGTCKPRMPADGACMPGTWECQDGLSCFHVCIEPESDGDACTSPFQCGWGLTCVGGLCVGVKSQGAACTDGIECDPAQDLDCIPNASGGGSSCMPTTYAGAGESCGSWAAMDCLDNAICEGMDAVTGIGVCSAAAADGSPCATGIAACQAPSLCINGKCQTAADRASSCN
jgi:hypothetical protein